MKLNLLVKNLDTRENQSVELEVGNAGLVIGRNASHFPLKDEYCSSRHLLLIKDTYGQLWAQDLASRNGVYLDGIRVSKFKISNGSELRIGRTYIRIQEITE